MLAVYLNRAGTNVTMANLPMFRRPGLSPLEIGSGYLDEFLQNFVETVAVTELIQGAVEVHRWLVLNSSKHHKAGNSGPGY